jgi:hypothetical protein
MLDMPPTRLTHRRWPHGAVLSSICFALLFVACTNQSAYVSSFKRATSEYGESNRSVNSKYEELLDFEMGQRGILQGRIDNAETYRRALGEHAPPDVAQQEHEALLAETGELIASLTSALGFVGSAEAGGDEGIVVEIKEDMDRVVLGCSALSVALSTDAACQAIFAGEGSGVERDTR